MVQVNVFEEPVPTLSSYEADRGSGFIMESSAECVFKELLYNMINGCCETLLPVPVITGASVPPCVSNVL